MKYLITLLLVIATTVCYSQTEVKSSAFKKLPRPHKMYGAGLMDSTAAQKKSIIAYRFTAPTAGTAFYKGGEVKVVTGIGFGLQKLHWVDETQKYYADYSVKATVFAMGNVTPSFTDNNVLGVGIMAGLLNELINFGFIYNIPTEAGTKGKLGAAFSIGIALNN